MLGGTRSPPIADAGKRLRRSAAGVLGVAAGLALCSPVEVAIALDLTPPKPPTLTGTTPRSPANENLPRVNGLAESQSVVRIYASAGCAGDVAAKGSPATLHSTGIAVTVPDDSTTTLTATATDRAGNVSKCSKALTYVEDSTPPETAIDGGPTATTFDSSPTFRFSASQTSTFECSFDGAAFAACTSPRTYPGLDAGTEHVFGVRATDKAGNADPSPAELAFAIPATLPPNILLIVTDDQPDAGTMVEMPRTLDIFGNGGVTFENAYATTPLCCPSRASIFSGRYAHNHGITINNGAGFDASQTWQRYLHDAGYRTGIVGHYLNQVAVPKAPHFDYRVGWATQDPEDPRLMEAYAEDFLDQAEAEDSQPWVLVAAVHSPHQQFQVQPVEPDPIAPYDPPPSFGEADLSDKHPAVAEAASDWGAYGAKTARTGQLTELQAVDESIGDLFGLLGARQEKQGTLAIFTADNGYFWGHHKLAGKEWPYLETSRVPLYMRWPGQVGAGAVTQQIVANIDIAPTLFAAAGLQPGYPLDGRSLIGSPPRSRLLLEFPTGAVSPPWSAYVSATRHYIQWADGSGFVEDYDLVADPYEMAASNVPDVAIGGQIAADRACVGTACP